MGWRKAISIVVPVVGAGAAALAFLSYREAMAQAESVWQDVAFRAEPSAGAFDPAMVANLPEIAQRYFRHAIAPGTPLSGCVVLEMQGVFLLGDKRSYQTYAMKARQILRPPRDFVWIPTMQSGFLRISGFDALVAKSAWTRFWLFGLIPVANAQTSADLVRSARFRSAMEGVWVPTSLLPQNGAQWDQLGPDQARIRLQKVYPEVVLDLTLGKDGSVREVIGQRWSNANPEQVFRLQPFGGTISSEATFGGYTIPSALRVGNHFGTDDFLPFFQVEVTRADYL